MYLEDLAYYKDVAIRKLVECEAVIDILCGQNTRTEETDEILLKHHVLPFLYQPDVEETKRRYVCLETNVLDVDSNIIKTMSISVYVYAHKDLVRLPAGSPYSGTAIDALCNQVDLLFNGSRDFGIGKMFLQPTELIRPTDNYYGRVLKYICSEFNRPRN